MLLSWLETHGSENCCADSLNRRNHQWEEAAIDDRIGFEVARVKLWKYSKSMATYLIPHWRGPSVTCQRRFRGAL